MGAHLAERGFDSAASRDPQEAHPIPDKDHHEGVAAGAGGRSDAPELPVGPDAFPELLRRFTELRDEVGARHAHPGVGIAAEGHKDIAGSSSGFTGERGHGRGKNDGCEDEQFFHGPESIGSALHAESGAQTRHDLGDILSLQQGRRVGPPLATRAASGLQISDCADRASQSRRFCFGKALDPTHPGMEAAPELLSAADIMPIVYDELRKLAAAKMARESAAFTLQPTALVHEAWLRLGNDARGSWKNRAHFFGAAAEAMRRILIDDARRRGAVRHGGGLEKVSVEAADVPLPAPAMTDANLLLLNEAMEHLAVIEPRKAELVKQCYFVGLTVEEAAEVLGISLRTAQRDWSYTRAWLVNEMKRLGG